MSDKTNKLINGFLKNVRLIASLITEVMEKTIRDFPQILEEDEQKCRLWETNERKSWIALQMQGSKDPNLLKRYEKESESIKRVRFPEAIISMKKYYRLSHVLDENGYNWDKFFHNENDEPESERLLRQLIDNDSTRTEWRTKIMRNFIKHTYKFWPMIKEENIEFFTNYLAEALPDTEYTDKLEIIYGNNNSKKYISDENIKKIWKMIHGSIKVAIKYMYYMKHSSFTFTKMVGNEKVVSHVLNIDVQNEINIWDVNLEVK